MKWVYSVMSCPSSYYEFYLSVLSYRQILIVVVWFDSMQVESTGSQTPIRRVLALDLKPGARTIELPSGFWAADSRTKDSCG
jgi:hypothetical protein